MSTLEQTLCGYVREGDVPGFEIPARYFRYVHGGDARPLAAVLEHNRLDLLSLALVTARAAQLLDEGAPGRADGTGSARHGPSVRARRNVDGGQGPALRGRAEFDGPTTRSACAEALRAYAIVSRRMRQYDDAAAAWRRCWECRSVRGRSMREASEALAVHLEHRRRDLMSARDFAARLLGVDESVTRRQAVGYRLARLDRKLESRSQQAPLF